MFKARLIGTAMAAALLLAGPTVGVAPFVAPATAQQAQVSFNIFFDRLSSGGVWVKSSRYDYVWCPRVDTRWSPYTHGHWIYLRDRGWYFDSDEPFAWAVYHYGRWYRDADIGWCWVPGDVWAPAWVTWRRSDDYVGWAPLAPEGNGFAVGTRVSRREVPQDDWVFVQSHDFLEPQLSVTIVFGSDKPDVYRRTRDVGPVVVHNDIVVNNVININFVEQQTKQTVTQVKVETADQPQTTTAAVDNETIKVFNPKLEKPAKNEGPQQAVAADQAKEKLSTMTPATSGENNAAAGTNGAATNGANGTGTAPGTNAAGAANGTQAPAGDKGTNNGASTATPPAGTTEGEGNKAKPGKAPTANPTCAADEELVNGKCRPSKPNGEQGGKNGENGANATGGANAATDNNATSGNNKPAGPSSKQENAGKSENAGNGNKADAGKAPATCAADESLVNGKCVPAKPKNGGNETRNGGDNAAAQGSDNGAASDNAGNGKPAGNRGAQQENGGASSGAMNGSDNGKPAAGKAGAKCPPGEEFVKGACRAAGAAKGDNAGADAGASSGQ